MAKTNNKRQTIGKIGPVGLAPTEKAQDFKGNVQGIRVHRRLDKAVTK